MTRVSRGAFLNASQASQTLAPQGVLSKLGENVNARFRNATRSAGAVAPATLEGGSGGVSVNATRDGVKDTPIRVRAFSPKHLTNLVGGIREGRERRTEATSSSSPSSSSPPLSERAVTGVLGSVFKDTAKEGGGGGGRARATVAEQAGSMDGGAREEKLQGSHETGKHPVEACATTASDGNRSSGLLGRFGRPSQGWGKTKSSPPLTTPGPANEPRQVNNGGGSRSDKSSRERRGVSGKVDSSSGVPAARAMAGVAARSSAPVVASTAPPPARPKVDKPLRPAMAAGSATDAVGKPAKQRDALRATETVVRPDGKRPRRSRDGTEEERHWPDIDVAAGSSTDDNNLIDKIRAPLAKFKVGGRGPRGEEASGGKVKVETDGTGRNGGNAVVARMRDVFGRRRKNGGGESESSVENVPDALDEIGLGG